MSDYIVIERPRPFVRSKSYFGPDRRRRVDENYRGEERRKEKLQKQGQEPETAEITTDACA